MRITRSLVSLVVLLALASACAKGANVTPQMQVAKLGGDMLAAVKIVQQTTASLEASKVIPEADAAKAMAVYERIGTEGQKLAGLLTAYDATADLVKKNVIGKNITGLLGGINTLVMSSLVPIQSGPAREQLSKLLDNVGKIILQIQAQVPDLSAPEVK